MFKKIKQLKPQIVTAHSIVDSDAKKIIADMSESGMMQNHIFSEHANTTIQQQIAAASILKPYVFNEDDLKTIEKSAPKFSKLLQKMLNKSVDLKSDDPNKALTASLLHSDLVANYLKYYDNEIDYGSFKANCAQSIANASNTLKEHRGWKELFLNLIAIVGTLGGTALYQLYKTSGQHCFFSVNTDSINIAENLIESIEQIKPLETS